MGSSTLDVRPYSGTLASLNLGGVADTSLLNAIGSSQSGTFSDDNGSLSSADNGVTSFQLGAGSSQTITYLGSGTISTVSALGIKLDPRPIAIFMAGGQIYFITPNGLPLLSGVSVSIDIDVNAAYTLPNFIPCFCAGTLIATPEGERLVETLQAGDHVVDWWGQWHEIRWIGISRLGAEQLSGMGRQKLHPVVIPPNSFGPGRPYCELRVSPQHRLLLDGSKIELFFGEHCLLAPAIGLVGDHIRVDRACTEVTYCHILCDSHVILQANGMPSESLHPGRHLRNTLDRAAWQEIVEIFPDLRDHDRPPAAMMVSVQDAKLLAPVRKHARGVVH